jgi:hypothetical protein
MTLKWKFDDATWEVQNLGKCLAMADAYRRLEPHALYGVQVSEDICHRQVTVSDSGSILVID